MHRLLPFLLLAPGCALPILESGFQEDLDRTGGCADVILFAVDADDEVMLHFSTVDEGRVAEASVAGTPLEYAFTLPSDGIELEVRQGTQVSDITCDDVAENGGPDVLRRWTAEGGDLILTLTPGGDLVAADLVLQDVDFLDEDGNAVGIDVFTVHADSVGWFAG
jgi:hypothetical protein